MNDTTLIAAVLIIICLYTVGAAGKNQGSVQVLSQFFGLTSKLIGGLFSIVIWLFRGKKNSHDIHGDAKFMTWRKRNNLISSKNKGVVIEKEKRLPQKISMQQIAIVAANGYGKTTSYVIPQLLAMQGKPDRSFVVTDPSGEVFAQTSGYLNSIGYRIEKINLASPSQSNFGFNALSSVHSHSEIEEISDVLVRSAFPEQNASTSFWNDMAKGILSTHIKCLKSPDISNHFQTLANLRFLLNQFGKNGKPLLTFYKATADILTHNELLGILGNEPKVLLSALSTAKTALKLFSNPDVCAVTSSIHEHSFERLRKVPTIMYVGLEENKQQTYQSLLSLFYNELFSVCMQMPNPKSSFLPIYCLLDEAGNLYLPNLDMYISTLRKRDMSLSLILQSEKQLFTKYGREAAETILSNCGVRVYYPGLDLDTCQKLENTMGTSTIEYSEPTRSFLGGTKNQPIRLGGKSLMTADQIRMMQNPLLLAGNHPPTMLVDNQGFYKNKKLLKRSQMPPAPFVPLSGKATGFIDLSSF